MKFSKPTTYVKVITFQKLTFVKIDSDKTEVKRNCLIFILGRLITVPSLCDINMLHNERNLEPYRSNNDICTVGNAAAMLATVCSHMILRRFKTMTTCIW
jgi:hypothetical protein